MNSRHVSATARSVA